MARDRTGLVHFAVPLVLGEHPLGALVAGQVFDQYPEQLPLEQVARQLGLSPAPVWQVARLEHPVKRATLEVYADLLATLGQTFLQTRYHTILAAERRGQERTAEANEGRARLLKQVMSAREEEQRRIARDLHDGIGQSLTSLLLGLRAAAEVPTFEEARARLGELRGITASLLDEVRRLARGLRPIVLDDLGLAAALERYAAEYTQAHGIAVDVYAPDLALARLPAEVETALYRIAQETLTNVLKHAAAKAVSLVVRRELVGRTFDGGRRRTWVRQRCPAPGAWRRQRSGPARHPRTGRPSERLRHARVAAGKRNHGPRVHSPQGGEPWRRFAS